jgi:hypothetical protein
MRFERLRSLSGGVFVPDFIDSNDGTLRKQAVK